MAVGDYTASRRVIEERLGFDPGKYELRALRQMVLELWCRRCERCIIRADADLWLLTFLGAAMMHEEHSHPSVYLRLRPPAADADPPR